jgi:hypothetical protein
MSLVFEIEFDGETLQIEVTRGGELIFLDHDIKYDLGQIEFGYPKTDAAEIHESWREDRVGTLLTRLLPGEIEEKTIALIAIEWAEHVLPIFESFNKKSKRPRILLTASRDFVLGNMSHYNFTTLRKKLKDLGAGSARVSVGPSTGSILARRASYSAAKTATLAAILSPNAFIMAYDVANLSQRAAAYDFCYLQGASAAGDPIRSQQGPYGGGVTIFKRSQEFVEAEKSETDWQIARFVDVMEAIGQGLDWPPIGEEP